ncbi:MAG: hypothetical protein IJ870_05955 [Alphaproteobacteria bacterium]|nr:hypothetical protein [Alphaproteobacteria bacterium]
MAVATVLAFFATSCYHSTVTEIGDRLATFTKRADNNTELFGVKNTFNDIEIVPPIYEQIVYSDGLIVARRGKEYTFYSRYGVKKYEHLKINNVRYFDGYMEFQASEGKYLYIEGHELFGAYADYTYYVEDDLIMYSLGGGHFGALRPMIEETLVEPLYAVVVRAIDENGHEEFYFGDQKVIKKRVHDKEVTLTSKQSALLKKDAELHGTPWPARGYVTLEVKTLR